MQEWSRLSVEQQLGSIICCAPIPVHPSLNPHQKVQMSHSVRFRRHLAMDKCSDIPTLSNNGKFMTSRIDLIENENPKTLNSHCAQSFRIGVRHHSDALAQMQAHDGASPTLPADKAGMPAPTATAGLSPLQRCAIPYALHLTPYTLHPERLNTSSLHFKGEISNLQLHRHLTDFRMAGATRLDVLFGQGLQARRVPI